MNTPESLHNDALDPATAESQRAFVREMNARVQSVYAWSGALALCSAAGVLLLFWVLEALWTIAPWPLSLLTFLSTLFFARAIIRKKTQIYRAHVLEYCTLNDFDPNILYEYYKDDDTYSFFVALIQPAQHPPTE